MSARLVPVVVRVTSGWEHGKKLQADLDSACLMQQTHGPEVSVDTYATVDGTLCMYGTINLRWLEPEPEDEAVAAQLAELYLRAEHLPDFRAGQMLVSPVEKSVSLRREHYTLTVGEQVSGPKLTLDLKTLRHALSALRELGRERCHRSNCGTVCLCGPCHARAAQAELDPDWRPR